MKFTKAKEPKVNPNPKPYTEWILRQTNAWSHGGWLFSEDGTTGYWEFAVISGFKNGIKKTMDEIKQEAKEAYELFYGKPKKQLK